MRSESNLNVMELEPAPTIRRRYARSTPARPMAGVAVGRIIEMDESGVPLVDFAGNPSARPVSARSTVAISNADIGREAAIMFEGGQRHRPIVVGILQTPRVMPAPVQAEVDGEVVTLEAQQEIVLRCGKASITLTRAGKVLIRGTYVLSRSSGANRIKGGSVQIN